MDYVTLNNGVRMPQLGFGTYQIKDPAACERAVRDAIGVGSHPVITRLAEKYGRNAGQIILRFEVQSGLIVLPKSTNPERIAGNLRIFDFELTEEEMNQMYDLDTGQGSHDPEAPGVAEMLLQNHKIHD